MSTTTSFSLLFVVPCFIVYISKVLLRRDKGDREKYAINFSSGGKIVNWPRRKGPYLHFLTHSVSFDVPEWMLLDEVDKCEQLSNFLSSEKLNIISKGKDYLEFVSKYPMRTVIVHK